MSKSNENILVIRLSAMGDCAMAVPVLLRVHQTYPQLKITVLTKPFFAPIFETLPQDIRVLTADTKNAHQGFFGLLKLAFQLRNQRFTALADIHNVLRSTLIRNVLAFSGIKFKTLDKGRKEKKALTRSKNKVFKPLKTTPERYADVFKALGYPVELSGTAHLKKPELSTAIRELIGSDAKHKLGIAPFAAHSSKTYPIELIEKIIAEIAQSETCQILLFGGGKKENTLLDKLGKKYKNTICVAGKLSFKAEIKLVAHLDAMLSMDSGNGHLAAMYDIPVITLWGATHPYAGFAPFDQPKINQLIPDLHQYPLLPTSVFGKKQVEGYEKVMYTIAPEKVLTRIKKVLN